ncbi:MAG: hypothetical protein J0L92_36115 [Deltaproteobacteria bacterium]|nr:hypothetical protein [Deltaproteobacteria bacterium]
MKSRSGSRVVVVLSGLLAWLALGATVAEAQEAVVVTPASLYGGPARRAHLLDADEATLEFPAPEEYALPITGVVLGGAMAVGGAGVGVVMLLGAVLSAGFGGDASWTAPYALAGLAGAAVGAIILGFSIDALQRLGARRREAREARDAGITTAFVMPSADGMMAGLGGTF